VPTSASLVTVYKENKSMPDIRTCTNLELAREFLASGAVGKID